MNNPISGLCESLQVVQSSGKGCLQLFDLHGAEKSALDYLILDEAVASQCFEVTEVNEGGSVPFLLAMNKGDRAIFLMAGEQLIGAKQNRILNVSILVAAHSTEKIPVSCVESGRWHRRTAYFAPGKTAAHHSLRKMLHVQTGATLQSGGMPSSDQSAVWREVERKLRKMKSASPTQALETAYEDHQTSLDGFLTNLKPSAASCGVAFAVQGVLMGADLFDKAATLSKLWPKLLQTYAIDALEYDEAPFQPITMEHVQQSLRATCHAQAEQFASIGLGVNVRLNAPQVTGAGLVIDEHPVHVELYFQQNGWRSA